MSSSTPEARHYAGRHRVRTSGAHASRAPRPGSALPAATAAALVLTAAGATLAQQVLVDPPVAQASAAPVAIDLSTDEVVAVRAEEAAETTVVADLAVRRQAATLQSSATRGRAEAKQRADAAARRQAAAAKAARAKKAKAERAARAKALREGRRWVAAIRTGRLTSDFGPRWGRTHDGLDVGAPSGTPLHAMSRGTVILAGMVPSFGNKVEIRYWDGTVSWYGHLSRIDVREGEVVMPGDVVGAVGNTGHSFGSHLHLEIHPSGGDNPIDPAPWLRAKGILVG